jgi:peptide deformylase
MAVLPIKIYPQDTVLRQKAKKVHHIDASVLRLVDDMIETMQAYNGVGLAAPQVGKSLRVIVIQIPDEEPFAVINPEITERTGERDVVEGCLSIPGYVGEIKRSESIKLRGKDCNGKIIRIKADELLSEALEHETDHLDGVLYVDYLESPDKLRKLEPPEQDDSGGEES